jgi:hypothetical protein
VFHGNPILAAAGSIAAFFQETVTGRGNRMQERCLNHQDQEICVSDVFCEWQPTKAMCGRLNRSGFVQKYQTMVCAPVTEQVMCQEATGCSWVQKRNEVQGVCRVSWKTQVFGLKQRPVERDD